MSTLLMAEPLPKKEMEKEAAAVISSAKMKAQTTIFKRASEAIREGSLHRSDNNPYSYLWKCSPFSNIHGNFR